MSMPLPSLINLAYSLSCGRKRRSEWESLAEMAPRKQPAWKGSGQPLPACIDKNAPVVSADAAEIRLLDASLRSQGLLPRAADAETAILRLLSADARTGKSSQACSLEGTDFAWISAGDVTPAAAQGPFEILCPVKSVDGKGGQSADDAFARMVGATSDIPEDGDALAPPDVMTDVPAEHRQATGEEEANAAEQQDVAEETPEFDNLKDQAMSRLLSLIYASAAYVTDTEDASDHEDDGSSFSAESSWDSDTSDFAREMATAALLEAENDELDRTTCSYLARAVAIKCNVSV